jgi:hypothetical protein
MTPNHFIFTLAQMQTIFKNSINISFHSQNIQHHNLPFLINIFLKQLHNKIVPKYNIIKFKIPKNSVEKSASHNVRDNLWLNVVHDIQKLLRVMSNIVISFGCPVIIHQIPNDVIGLIDENDLICG